MILIMDMLPWFLRRRIMERKMGKTGMKVDKLRKMFGGWAQFKHIYESRVLYAKTPKAGAAVPNFKLTNLKTKKIVSIQDLARPGIPLVLNFGSCTCDGF